MGNTRLNDVKRICVLAAVLAGMVVAGPAAAEVRASDGWMRATPPGAKSGAAYLIFTNSGGEARKLLKIISPVSDEVSVHRTSVTAEGMSRMWPLASFTIDPGQTVRFEPGGLHVMFGALKAPLAAGQKVPLTLKFDGGEAEFTVQLEVKPLVPAADERADQMQMR
jgi:copper(I)-binding protein